jgi:hypothetical protein
MNDEDGEQMKYTDEDEDANNKGDDGDIDD